MEPLGRVAEWQTRWLQVPVSARTWGFKSPLAHEMTSHIAHDAEISDSAQIGDGSQVWNLTQVRDGVKIGSACVIGRSVYIGPGVRIGNNCKIQNNALVYDPAVLDDGVFIGPGVILTNDRVPRAVTPDGDLKSAADWDPVGVRIGTGASIGAGSVCVAPISIGAWAMVAAGSTVIRDVPDHALVAGNPARLVGWVGRGGTRLQEADGLLVDATSGDRYRETDGQLTRLS